MAHVDQSCSTQLVLCSHTRYRPVACRISQGGGFLFGGKVNLKQARIQDSEGGGGFVQEFRLENRSYPDVHDFSLRMQVITCIAND